jgi:hypothetical protein
MSVLWACGQLSHWTVSTTPRPLYPRERPGTHCTGGWVGPRVGLDVCEKSRPHRDSIPGPSARSQSLHRLSYPAPIFMVKIKIEIKLDIAVFEL